MKPIAALFLTFTFVFTFVLPASTSVFGNDFATSLPGLQENQSSKAKQVERLLRCIDSTQENVLLEFLNCRTLEDLLSMDGVARTRAAAIVEARPLHDLRQLADIKGIGIGAITKIVKHLEELEGGGSVNLNPAKSEPLLCK